MSTEKFPERDNPRQEPSAPNHTDYTYSNPRPASVEPPLSSHYPYPLPPEPGRPQAPYPPYPQTNSSEQLQAGRAQPGAFRPGQAPVQAPVQESVQGSQLVSLPMKPVLATYALLAMIGAMFVITIALDFPSQGFKGLSGEFSNKTLLDLGALYGSAIRQNGEWWRLITVMFLHANLLHIFLNGLSLYSIGKELESIFGSFRFLVIFFVSGITGSVVSFGLHPDVLAVGASGAIFGLVGALIGYFLRQRSVLGSAAQRNLRNLLLMVGINFVILFAIPGVDNLAHLGGLGGGVVLGFLLSPIYVIVRAAPGPAQTGLAQIKEAHPESQAWLLYALGWLVLVALVFLFFLNNPQPGGFSR